MKEDPRNYRPIHVVSVLEKIMEENTILGNTKRHLKNNTIISHSQYGLTKGKVLTNKLIW